MYAQRTLDRLALVGVGVVGRVGHDAVDRGATIPGFVPQVTCGFSSADVDRDASIELRTRIGAQRRASRRAQRSQAAPPGAAGRPSRYANVTSSGAIIPARAPASIDMLQTVMRPSIESASIAGPAYSST